jgi:MoaA/NifB/PqqE/SkfB family radical SAM enzyme
MHVEVKELVASFRPEREPLACMVKRRIGEATWYGMGQDERKSITEPFINLLTDTPTREDRVSRHGVRTRFRRLLATLSELNANNSVALWTRYFWDYQIAKILHDEPYNPSALEIDLTTYCDSGCFFCKEGQEKKAVQYPFSKLEQDLLEYSGVPETCLVIYSGGGEPTCYKHFRYAMQLAHDYGYSIYVSTHGGSIGLKNLPHGVFTENCTILKLSIGGASHDTYNKVHNGGRQLTPGEPRTVDHILRQCRTIAENRRTVVSMGAPVKLPRIFIAMTLSPINQHEVLLMTERAIEAGADTVLFRPVITTYQPLLAIDEGIRQMQEARERYGKEIEILTFNHRLDYGHQREDYFGRCICHPVINPESADGRAGSITPCLFRRGNRPQNTWLSGGEPNKFALTRVLQSVEYSSKVREQDVNLHAPNEKRCPRCRKVVNNIFLDILFQASPLEREIMRAVVLLLFPRNSIGEIIRGLH